MQQEFYLSRDGRRIHCKLDLPDEGAKEAKSLPLLVLIHGFTGHMEEQHLLGIRDRACALGWGVLRAEMYGHGKSDGAFMDHTIGKWVEQILTVVSYARELPYVSGIVLAGHSQGGLATILAGAMLQDVLTAIIPLSPAIVIRDGARCGQMLGMSFDPDNIPSVVTREDGSSLRGDYFRVAAHLPVEEAIDSFQKPVLIVHGDADEAVPVQYAIDAAARYRQAKLVIISGDLHCYEYHLDQVEDAVEHFLKGML